MVELQTPSLYIFNKRSYALNIWRGICSSSALHSFSLLQLGASAVTVVSNLHWLYQYSVLHGMLLCCLSLDGITVADAQIFQMFVADV